MSYDDEVMGIDEILGTDDIMGADDVMGAMRARAARGLMARARQIQVPKVPGVAPHGGRRFPLGLGTFTFTNTSGTATLLTGRPQVPFKATRLIVDVARSVATLTQPVNLQDLQIGTKSQFAGGAVVPASAFQAGAFDAFVDCDPAVPGIDITLDVRLGGAALGAGETIIVTATLFGASMS